MLLPESMSRIVIVGNKSRLDDMIDVLYSLDAVHLIDHTTGQDEGFAIGKPRPYASKASERLLALRTTEKDLGIKLKGVEMEPVSVKDIEAEISSNGVETVMSEVMSAIDEKNRIVQNVAELKAQEASLTKLSKLPINLELYSGYESIAVFVGSVKADPTAALEGLSDAETFVSFAKDGGVAAVFVKKSEKDKAASVLSEYGYSEIQVPAVTGSAADALAKTQSAITAAEAELVNVDARIAELSEKYKTFIVASDEELSLTVKKGETPMRIATSEYSFVIDGWVPAKDVDGVVAKINEAMDNNVYIEIEEKSRGRSLHEEAEQEPRFQKAPTKMKNGAVGKRFEYPTKLISIPKYQEIDPSTIIAIFFPFFFGFMVGDLGYAIPFICLGALGLRHSKTREFQAIGTVLFYGGIWAAIFGFFFFGEMLGMHFVTPHPSAEQIQGMIDTGLITSAMSDFHNWGTAEYLALMEYTHEISWEQLFMKYSGNMVLMPDWFTGIMIEGHGISKLGKATFLLKLSVYMGIVHLFLAYLIAFLNVTRMHGIKEGYLEKGGWIVTFVGMTVFCYALTTVMFGGDGVEMMDPSTWPSSTLPILGIGALILIIGVASCFPKEKMMAILDLPGIVGNILSYTRLAAIGMSKAGMALAFNYIAFIMLGGGIFGIIVFVIGHLMIWVLAIISAGLHGLRLQYVEMMNKFFIGGGVEYSPLAEKRKHTNNKETEA
jgi:V/A-type H+/Na+-transporting ATPase subunit I